MTSICSGGAVAEEILIELHTQDGSIDLKGNPILRSKTGVWKACSFLVVYEVFERFAFYGISCNLILYLTKKLHQGTVTAANNVTTWNGTVWLAPIIGAYIADAHLGRYWTFLIASLIHVTQMLCLFPIMKTSILPSTMVAQVNTLFVKQETTLDRGLGNFQIPPASLASFFTIQCLFLDYTSKNGIRTYSSHYSHGNCISNRKVETVSCETSWFSAKWRDSSA
ncbi:hypothetical protein MKX01_002962 [Papaver californicum]|nr:hypothetical protein MKX01_002962 [Papaver californicum]